jgi:hypothetical protein
VDADSASLPPAQSSDLFAQSSTFTESKAQPAKKRKGGGRASGSIDLPESWSDARRGIVGEWFSHRLALGKHITTAQFSQLCVETASLSDTQFRACVDDAIVKRQQLQPHKFADAQRDMLGPPVDLIERIYAVYPRKEKKPNAIRAIQKAIRNGIKPETLLHLTELYAAAVARWGDSRYTAEGRDIVPHPASWFNAEQFNDDPANWELRAKTGKKEAPPRPAQAVVGAARSDEPANPMWRYILGEGYPDMKDAAPTVAWSALPEDTREWVKSQLIL